MCQYNSLLSHTICTDNMKPYLLHKEFKHPSMSSGHSPLMVCMWIADTFRYIEIEVNSLCGGIVYTTRLRFEHFMLEIHKEYYSLSIVLNSKLNNGTNPSASSAHTKPTLTSILWLIVDMLSVCANHSIHFSFT